MRVVYAWLALCLLATSLHTVAEPPAEEFPADVFDDEPLDEPLALPPWFKLSFLDLREDVREVAEAGKRGLIIYFGQKYCAYCKALLEVNFAQADIETYTRRYFDVIGLDIHGSRPVTTLDGKTLSEQEYAHAVKADFTPTLLFYDVDGKEALRLRGYYPPYQFLAALEFVADGHYVKERFRDYLARADVPMVFEEGGLNQSELFDKPPYALDRSQWPAERPLIVFFEQGDCHACDVLHTGPLRDERIVSRLRNFQLVQLGIWDQTPVLTPGGKRTTARAWADELGLFYTPTLLIFDTHGKEILRVDSVVQFFRLRNVLDYVLTGAYKTYPNFQRWRDAAGRWHLPDEGAETAP